MGSKNSTLVSGCVVIKNWKPLPLEMVCSSPLATVGEVLGELTALATLRIQLLRPRTPMTQDMRDKLLRLLLLHGHALLLSTGCPLDEVRKRWIILNIFLFVKKSIKIYYFILNYCNFNYILLFILTKKTFLQNRTTVEKNAS